MASSLLNFPSTTYPSTTLATHPWFATTGYTGPQGPIGKTRANPSKKMKHKTKEIMHLNEAKNHIKILLKEKIPIFVWGQPGIGKCLQSDTLVFDHTTGLPTPISKFDPRHKVLTFVNGELVPTQPIAKKKQGKQVVYEIKTKTGKKILATFNHPFYKLEQGSLKSERYKWVELGNLSKGDLVATTFPNFFGSVVGVDDEVKLLAYLIGDGHYKKVNRSRGITASKASFTNSDPKIITEYKNILDNKGWKYSVFSRKGTEAVNIVYKKGDKTHSRDENKMISFLDIYGLKFARAGGKEIPSKIFNLEKRQVALFLNRLFACDGSFGFYETNHKNTGKQRTINISYSSKSAELIKQTSHLLRRFHITSYIREKNIQGSTYYELSITDSISALNFIKNIGIFGKKSKVIKKATPYLIKYVSSKSYYRGGIYRMGLLFDRIKSIKKVGKRQTYDLEIPISHNFIAEDFVVHNSSIVAQICDDWKWKLIDLRLSLLNPVDLRGLPYFNKEKHEAVWLKPEFLPTRGKGILFLDELNTAPTSVQIAAYQLLLDRKIGNYVFPDNWRIVAAGNRATDLAAVTKLPSPLANRLIHIEVEAHIDDWKLWAQGKIDNRIIAFLSFRPNLLAALPKEEIRAYPTPRSWEFTSRILKLYPDVFSAESVLKGTVGQGATKELLAFLQIYKDLPNIEGILRGAVKTVPKKVDVLYALSSALVARLKTQYLDNFLSYTLRMPPEFATLAVRDAARNGWDAEIQKSKFWKQWANKFNEYL